MIELRQLRYLLAAAEAGSFSRAARNLNIKQATLSRHILQIEQRLGMVLFDRRTRGAILTSNGSTYLRTAQRIVREFEELNDWVRATRSGQAGRLAVGFYTSLSAGNLRATLTEFGTRYPDIEIRSFERDRELLLGGIESGLLDIAIAVGEERYRNLSGRAFWSERILVAMPEQHPLAGRDRLHWSDLLGERFLLTVQDPGPEARAIIMAKLGLPGHATAIDTHEVKRDTMLSMIALGTHVSIIAESAIGIQVPGVVFKEVFEPSGQTRVGFSGYWRADNENPALRQFLDFVVARYSLPPAST